MPSQSLGSYPGAASLSRAEITITRGVTPDVGLVEILAADFQQLQPGPLTFFFNGVSYTLPDMLPNIGHLRRRKIDRQWFWSFEVWDHRWRWWNTPRISGRYNVRKADGTIDEATRKTPSELADLLFTKMGEAGFDTSRMPTGVWPTVDWDNALPVLELASLCEKVGCEVCGGEIAQATIWPLGMGGDLPLGGAPKHPPFRTVSAKTPSVLTVICGPTVWQTKLKTQAVGLDSDGTIKPIGSLSFTPGNGWSSECPFTLPSLSGTNQVNSLLTLYRWFRVMGQADGTLPPPGCTVEVSKVSQYQLRSVQLSSLTDPDGYARSSPSYVEGQWWPYSDDGAQVSGTTVFTGEIQIDTDLRAVILPYPVFSLGASGTIEQPTVTLVTSYTVNDPDGNPAALSFPLSIGGPGGEVVIRRPEIFETINTVTGVTTTSQASAEASTYLNIFQQAYAAIVFDDQEWNELVPLACDGKIAQVRFKVGAKEMFSTRASTGEEFDTTVRSKAQRRRAELLAQLQERAGL
jgi:hypothetical protein